MLFNKLTLFYFYQSLSLPLTIKGFFLPLAGVVVMVDIVAVVVGFVVISGVVVTLVGAVLVVVLYVVGVFVVVVGCCDVVGQ